MKLRTLHEVPLDGVDVPSPARYPWSHDGCPRPPTIPRIPRVKITVPPLPSRFLRRAGLNDALDAGASADFSLVSAPAGYGKTTLLADWSRSTGLTDTAWIAVDGDDNEPGRLWASIVASLARCAAVPPGNRVRSGPVWRPGAVPELVAELADALTTLPQPVRLVLDDVHELVDPVAVHIVRSLVRSMPATVRIVLAARLDPPLSLPRLRLGGRLQELRMEHLAFSSQEVAALLEASGLHLAPAQVDLLHRRTDGWAAGLQLAVRGLEQAADRDTYLAQFSGAERSVSDYLADEIVAGLPDDVHDFLRLVSVSDPVPTGLAAELTGRDDAGSMLDRIAHRTALVTTTGQEPGTYGVHELLRTHLLADLERRGGHRATQLHAVAARWWAERDESGPALDHAARSADPALLGEMLRRFAVPLLLRGDRRQLRHALTRAGSDAVAADPWLSLASSLGHLGTGETAAAQADLASARRCLPDRAPTELVVLRTVAEQFCGGAAGTAAAALPDADRPLPGPQTGPQTEALVRLARGNERLAHRDRAGARAEFTATLELSRRHDLGFLQELSLVLLGVVAVSSGDLRTTRTVCREVLGAAGGHDDTPVPVAAAAMLAYAELVSGEAVGAERVAADGLDAGTGVASPPLRFALRAVHGAAGFDLGDRAGGLVELQRARSDFGTEEASPEQCAAMAMLEFRAALLLGHQAAAQSALAWFAQRTGESGELLMMRAWSEAAGCHRDRARSLVRPVLEGSVPVLLPATVVDAWLLETAVALWSSERVAARHGLAAALAAAEPLDALRPFTLAEPDVRTLLIRHHGSFGPWDDIASRALDAGPGAPQQELLSDRELTVLGLLPSLLSLEEVAADLTVSVNTVKSHVRSIYGKLGVSSRRQAVAVARQRGLLGGAACVAAGPR